MKIGFITGRDDEVYDDEYLLSMTPKKYLVQGNYEKPLLHTDVAIAMTVKDSYPDVSVDIIQPKDITNQRLRKNDVNFILGYDCINQLIQEPYVRKFSGDKGYKLLHSIYSQPQNKVFPPMNFLEFIWAKDKYMRSVFMNGRHYKLLFLLTMQFALGIPPNLRTNIDYVFILRENYVSNRKRLYEHYAGMFPSFEMFCQVMDQCTENYECLVINNNAKSNKLTDQVFWYKAEPHDDFRICSKQAWEFSDQNCSNDNNNEYEGNSYKNKVVVQKNLY